MQSGVFWGYVGLIEGLVARIQAEYGKPMTVIGTGGLAPLFARRDRVIAAYRPRPDHGAACSRSIAEQPRADRWKRHAPSRRRSALRAARRRRRDRHELQPLRPSPATGSWSISASASPTTRLPGVDIVLPDPRFIEEQRAGSGRPRPDPRPRGPSRRRADLWPRLEAPIYARRSPPRPAREARGDRSRSTTCRSPDRRPGGKFTLGPFELELITITHSIPEPNALAHPDAVRHGAAHRRLEARSRRRWSASRPTRRACRRSATRACWPWCATAPTSSSPAPRAPRPRCATA